MGVSFHRGNIGPTRPCGRPSLIGVALCVAVAGVGLLAAGGCALFPKGRPPGAAGAEQDLLALRDAMIGSFSSAEQSAGDPENYYDIRLHVGQIWPERKDGVWLYIEQSAARSLDRPYRQRVYRLTAMPDGVLESAVFELPGDALQYAGAYKNPALLAAIKPEQLTPRTACSVLLRRVGSAGEFAGKTAGTGCESVLRGARYATSEVTITPTELRSWDRGFDEKNEQVWGTTGGPYVFRKVSQAEAEIPAASQPATSRPSSRPSRERGATSRPAASRPAASQPGEM